MPSVDIMSPYRYWNVKAAVRITIEENPLSESDDKAGIPRLWKGVAVFNTSDDLIAAVGVMDRVTERVPVSVVGRIDENTLGIGFARPDSVHFGLGRKEIAFTGMGDLRLVAPKLVGEMRICAFCNKVYQQILPPGPPDPPPHTCSDECRDEEMKKPK